MNARLLVISLLFLPTASYGMLESPGLYNQFVVETGGYDFTVTTVSTFDVKSYEFERDSKRLSTSFNTSVTENVMEITIPENLIGGNLSFYLNNVQIMPKILHQGAEKAFAVLEFSGKGGYKLDIVGTTYLPEFSSTLYVFAAAFAAVAIYTRYGAGKITLQGLR